MSFLKLVSKQLVVSSLTFSSFYTLANEASDMAAIKSNLESRNPPFKVKSVAPSPLAGIYEVLANGNMYYMDNKVSYVFVGNIFEDATKRNITADRKKVLTKISFESLPLKDAIKITKGNGKYKFAIFSDPDCPFCQALEKGFDNDKVSNYTAYVFLLPLKEIHPESAQKSESIWCAKDKSEAWLNWMVKDQLTTQSSCKNPIASNTQLAEKLGVMGTPTIYLNDGTQTQDPKELFTAITGKKVTVLK
jgi:thiol:disulfide interchange protein DsbC